MRACAGGTAVAVCGVLVAGVLSAAPAAAGTTAAVGAGGLQWGDCTDLRPVGDEKVQCATLEVPMDTGAPGGYRAGDATVKLALSRVAARGERKGTLVLNPGGPGSSGRDWASYAALGLPDDLRDSYDFVGFDPRGTGASTPAVACDPEYFAPVRPDTVPSGPAAEKELRARAASYAQKCGARNGALLSHVTTVDSARDIESIRAALGVERIDYLGYSYGTYLGGVYASLYPQRVRRLVLDSIVDPGAPWYRNNLAQTRSLDAAAQNFFDWTARHDAAYGLGGERKQVAERYYQVREQLAKAPLDGAVGPVEYENTFILAAYSAAVWPTLARALADYAVRDDPAALLAAEESYGESADSDPTYGAYLATECTDAPWPRDWSRWRDDGVAAHAEAPFQGWNNLWYNAPCMTWPAAGGDWFEVDGSEVRDALLIQATDDGPTPQRGAYAMRDRFPGSRLLIEDGGTSHGVALGGNACVDDVLADYLRDGTLPARGGGENGADLTCAAPPEPEPKPADAAGAKEQAPGPGTHGAR